MIQITTSLDFSLAHPDLMIEKMEPEEASYIGYDGSRAVHSCEEMSSGWESGFCNGGLYFLSARFHEDNPRGSYLGYTYSCKRHLRIISLRFSLSLEERSLSHEYDQWQDSLCVECGEPTDSSGEPHDHEQLVLFCAICGGSDGEHNWETHTAEALRPASPFDQP